MPEFGAAVGSVLCVQHLLIFKWNWLQMILLSVLSFAVESSGFMFGTREPQDVRPKLRPGGL
jgi:hypothetical protein